MQIHQACESAKLNSVSDILKSQNRIYQQPRGDMEVRVNDLNPLLLIFWQANMDIQFVAESSLAMLVVMSQKSERNNMQGISQ